jgi:hypothetical protein
MFGSRDVMLDLEVGVRLSTTFRAVASRRLQISSPRKSFRIPARARGIEGSRLA